MYVCMYVCRSKKTAYYGLILPNVQGRLSEATVFWIATGWLVTTSSPGLSHHRFCGTLATYSKRWVRCLLASGGNGYGLLCARLSLCHHVDSQHDLADAWIAMACTGIRLRMPRSKEGNVGNMREYDHSFYIKLVHCIATVRLRWWQHVKVHMDALRFPEYSDS